MAELLARRGMRRGDDGFTLIEMSIALIVLAIAMAALAAALISGFVSAQKADARTRGNQLAAQRIENLQSVDWGQLGMYKDDATAAGVWNSGIDAASGESIVKIADTTPSPAPSDMVRATSTQTIKGTTYTVRAMVTWRGSSAASPNDGTTFAAKRLSVTVSWTARGSTQTLRLADFRAPTSKEMRSPASAVTSPIGMSNGSAAPNQTLSASGMTTSALTFLVDSATPATGVTATIIAADGTPVVTTLTGDVTSKHWSGTLASGAGAFTPGATTVTFNATGSGGTIGSTTATVNLVAPAGSPFQLTGATATTVSTTLNSDNTLASPITLSVAASTTASAVTVQWKLPNGTTSGTFTLAYDSASSTWKYTIPVNTGPFVPGNIVFTLSGTPAAGGTPATASTSVSLAAPTLGDPLIANVTVSPLYTPKDTNGLNTTMCVDGNGGKKLFVSTKFAVEVKNVAANDVVQVAFGSLGTFTATPKGTTGTNGGYMFETTLAANTVISSSSLTYFATATRAVDGLSSAPYSKPIPVKSANNVGQC